MGQSQSRWVAARELVSDALEPTAAIEDMVAGICRSENVDLSGVDLLTTTGSVDTALRIMEALLPGWYVEHFGDDVSGRIGAMGFLGATCEVSDGGKTIQGQGPTRNLAILSSVFAARAELSEKDGDEDDR